MTSNRNQFVSADKTPEIYSQEKKWGIVYLIPLVPLSILRQPAIQSIVRTGYAILLSIVSVCSGTGQEGKRFRHPARLYGPYWSI
jgi:hypothetical protein